MSKKCKARFSISAIILTKVTKPVPALSFEISNPSDLEDLDLAEPYFNKSSQIDLILGNDADRIINLEGIKKNICGNTSDYKTIFGWVLSGPIKTETLQLISTTIVEKHDPPLSEMLRKS